MNLAFDPWIPVIDKEGNYTKISLCSAFHEGQKFIDLAVQPHERVALMRLFLCVAHAALNGPKDCEEWEESVLKLPIAAKAYLEEWKDSLELFHEKKPWLQVADITKSAPDQKDSKNEEWTPTSKLKFSFATGNNTTLFDHAGMSEKRKLSFSDLAISMITYQCFSPGGLISQVFWKGKKSSKSSKDSPCSPGSMYHAFIRGENLLRTIVFNLVTYDDIDREYGCSIGRPVWEKAPTSFEDNAAIENATLTFVGRLMPITRLIKLDPSGETMLLGDGLVYPTYTDGSFPEPSATVIERLINDKPERFLLSFRPDKAVWRELTAFVVKRKANKPGGPLCLLNLEEGVGFDIVIAGLARDKATIVETIESVFNIPSNLSSPTGSNTYSKEISNAEVVSSRLGWAVETWRMEIDSGWEGKLKSAGPKKTALKSKLHSKATIHYWTEVENKLSLLLSYIEAIGTDSLEQKKKVWRKALAAAAKNAYKVACSQETPRHIRAYLKGWEKLMTIYGILSPKTLDQKESA